MGSRRTYFLPVATAPVGSRATALCTVLHVVLWLPAAVLVDVSYPPNRILFGVAVFVCVCVCVCCLPAPRCVASPMLCSAMAFARSSRTSAY